MPCDTTIPGWIDDDFMVVRRILDRCSHDTPPIVWCAVVLTLRRCRAVIAAFDGGAPPVATRHRIAAALHVAGRLSGLLPEPSRAGSAPQRIRGDLGEPPTDALQAAAEALANRLDGAMPRGSLVLADLVDDIRTALRACSGRVTTTRIGATVPTAGAAS